MKVIFEKNPRQNFTKRGKILIHSVQEKLVISFFKENIMSIISTIVNVVIISWLEKEFICHYNWIFLLIAIYTNRQGFKNLDGFFS